MKTVQAGSQGWKNECLLIARAGKPFEIQGVHTSEHLEFCADVCANHDYRSNRKKPSVLLMPLKTK